MSGDTPTTSQIRVTREAREGGVVATLALDNARRLNSMNTPLMEEMVETLEALAREDDLRALILTGDGDKAFVGGADIKEMGAIASPHDARAFITKVHKCCHAVRAVPAPTIARINGFCFGAGFELAAACDLRVAADSAVFGMPEVKLGIPSVVEAALLPQLIGWGRTRQILLLGENFSAAEAEAWGFLEARVPAAELDAAVETWIGQLMTSTPNAVRIQKKLIRDWEDLPVRAAVQAGIDAFARAYESDEPAEAMAEFLAGQAARKAAQKPKT